MININDISILFFTWLCVFIIFGGCIAYHLDLIRIELKAIRKHLEERP